jgi:hypothetical protein
MSSVTFYSIYTGCGVKSFNGAGSFTPEEIIKSFIKMQGGAGSCYDVAKKKYVPNSDIKFSDCFVLWSDFDRDTCNGQCDPKKPTKKAILSGHRFAEYLIEHKLGEVTISPGRHNPLHPERILKDPKTKQPTGEVVGLLHVFIWAVDPIALNEWYKKNG